MVSVKVKFRASALKDKEGKIYYQIICRRVVRQLPTNYKLYSTEWDSKKNTVIAGKSSKRNTYLVELGKRIAMELSHIRSKIAALVQENEEITADEIILALCGGKKKYSLYGYIEELIESKRRQGCLRQCEIYSTTSNCFKRFMQGKDISINSLDARLMRSFETYLKGRVCINTSSFYMRCMRSIYNKAVEDGYVQQTFPFKHIYTGINKTMKRAVPVKVIRELKNLDLSDAPHLEFARDMFMFSFYTRGMAFVDMAYLRKSDLQGGVLTYYRRKTGQKLSVKWEKCMQNIVRHHQVECSGYLLPIIRRKGILERQDYRNMSAKINIYLRIISLRIGLTTPITMYVARHTWASVARSRNVPLSIISEGMGHDSELTTRIYLAMLDSGAVDRANKSIIDML